MAKICFITAIYGNYEHSCKPFAPQTVETDFICFTDNPRITSNGWIIDNHPYHLTHPNPVDTGSYRNSICNNKHTFNIAKYYKQSFNNIPRLEPYDVVVWLDGTIEITCDRTSAYILDHIYNEKIIGWHHEHRQGLLRSEAEASNFERYTSTHWNGQAQPYQDVMWQYNAYLADGYNESFFKNSGKGSHTSHFGVWITCFVAFLKNDEEIKRFLDFWYLQTLIHTTQDQVGFPYACQKSNLFPYTLPNQDISGDCPHDRTMFYIKHDHGK